MLKRNQRLSKNSDFIHLKEKGSSFKTPYFKIVYEYRTSEIQSRIGFIIGNHVGNAAARNLLKRRLRGIFQNLYANLTRPVDLIIIGRPALRDISFGEMRAEILRALTTLHLLTLPKDKRRT